MGPMKTASAHKQVYKIFKKGVGHELFLNQNLGHAAKKFGNHWTRSRGFIVGIYEVVQLATADESNLSDNDPIDEEDIILLEEAMSDTDDIITVTIDNAHPQSIEPNVIQHLFYLFYWRKICTPFDIPNYSLSGTVNLNYKDGHEPKPVEIFSGSIKLKTLMNWSVHRVSCICSRKEWFLLVMKKLMS